MRWLRKAIPLTRRGFLLAALALAAFAEGVIRADLAGLFWGAGFLLVPVYFLLAGHLLRAGLRRGRDRTQGFLAVSLPTVMPTPGEQASAHLRVELPRWFAPGLTVRFLLPLRWQDRKLQAVQARLAPGRTERDILFRADLRGVYRSREAILETSDVLGFTANPLAVPLRETLTVFPAVSSRETLHRVVAEGGDSTTRLRRRRRSEELLEARKYAPGDDPRRLNWKMFAHMDQLFVRVGEETPPPDSRLLVILDTACNPLVPRQLSGTYLDRLVESCASAACALLARRFALCLALPGLPECPVFTEESRAALLAALADAYWADPGWAAELPNRRSFHAVVVFSSPGSPALPGIMHAVAAHGWKASLFLQGLPADAAPMPLTPRKLLFQDAPGPAAPTRRQAAAFAEALARDLAAYRSPPWKVKHAAQA